MAGLSFGMLLLLAQRARQDGRLQDSIREEIRPAIYGPSIPVGTSVEYVPVSAKDKSRVHQFGKETLKRINLGYVQRARGVLVRNLDGSSL